jgi:hypothetical protein
MPNQPETFIFISSITWSAISSIATFSAVIVALFLPLYFEHKKKKNIGNTVELETQYNLDLLIKGDDCKEGDYNGTKISKINFMCPVLINLRIDIWKENKQTIAEISDELFKKYYEINNLINIIIEHANDIISKKSQSAWVVTIEEEVKICIEKIKKIKSF